MIPLLGIILVDICLHIKLLREKHWVLPWQNLILITSPNIALSSNKFAKILVFRNEKKKVYKKKSYYCPAKE